jgi:IPTL-CTERM motif
MRHKSTGLLAGVTVAVLLAQPSTAWTQAGPNLVISMRHTGNFTVGVNGVYTIVVSNIGGTASIGQEVIDYFYNDEGIDLPFTFVSAVGSAWSCSYILGFPSEYVGCRTSGVIAPGGSAPPITLTVLPTASGTVTNTVGVSGGNGTQTGSIASDPTIIVAAVPTLPEWAMIVLTALLALAGVTALRRRMT